MNIAHAFIAATRFGLGPGPGDLDRINGDPRGWLVEQLDRPRTAPEIAALPPPQEQVERFFALRTTFREERTRLAAASLGAEGAGADPAAKATLQSLQGPLKEIYLDEMKARTLAAIHSDTPFHERLVAFWSNHFTVSIQRPEIAGLAGAFEREAIRPHVLGRFGDMLLAVMRHPAMLLYLDNARSVGPNSTAGLRRSNLGLNENLGRELLELHTLGVDGGYRQDDVLAMAKMLTGWTITRPEQPGGGLFRFAPNIHEPGDKTLLRVRYEEEGEAEAQKALAALAVHPATARHIARKLATHFIADDPPQAAVERLAVLFLKTKGDLKAMARALIEAPEAWRDPLAKVKQPQDLVVSTLRASGIDPPDAKPLIASLKLLGQTPFGAPSPAGWSDTARDWLGPETLMHRIEWARAFAQKVGRSVSAKQIVDAALAPVASPATLSMIAAAGDPSDALVLALASREFQRR